MEEQNNQSLIQRYTIHQSFKLNSHKNCELCFHSGHPSNIYTTYPLRIVGGANPSTPWTGYRCIAGSTYSQITIHSHIHSYGQFRVSTVGGSRSTQRKHTQPQGEHATFKQELQPDPPHPHGTHWVHPKITKMLIYSFQHLMTTLIHCLRWWRHSWTET